MNFVFREITFSSLFHRIIWLYVECVLHFLLCVRPFPQKFSSSLKVHKVHLIPQLFLDP